MARARGSDSSRLIPSESSASACPLIETTPFGWLRRGHGFGNGVGPDSKRLAEREEHLLLLDPGERHDLHRFGFRFGLQRMPPEPLTKASPPSPCERILGKAARARRRIFFFFDARSHHVGFGLSDGTVYSVFPGRCGVACLSRPCHLVE